MSLPAAKTWAIAGTSLSARGAKRSAATDPLGGALVEDDPAAAADHDPVDDVPGDHDPMTMLLTPRLEDLPNELGENFKELAEALLAAPYRAVGPRELPRVVDEIVLDSLAPLTLGLLQADDQKNILDFGCGPGIPSLPLAMMMPHSKFHGIDATAKRIRFATSLAEKFHLPNITFEQTRTPHGRYTVILARGLAPLEETLRLARPLLSRGGRILIYSTPEAIAERLPYHLYRRPSSDRDYAIAVFHVKHD